MTRVTDVVDAPRIRIHLFEQGSNQYELFLDSAVDNVISYNFEAPADVLNISVLDPNGEIAKRLSGYSLAQYTRRHLDKHGYVVEGDENVVHRVTYEFINSGQESGQKYGTVIAFKSLQGSKDNSLVNLTIAASVKHRSDGTFGSTTLGGGLGITGSIPVGTVTKLGEDYGGRLSFDWEIQDVINAVEQLLARPLISKDEKIAAAVCLPDEVCYAMRIHLTNISKEALPGYLSEYFKMATTRSGDQLYLSYSPHLISEEELAKEDLDPAHRNVSKLIQQTIVRLNDIAERLEVTTRFTFKTLTSLDWLAVFDFPGEVNAFHIFSSDGILTAFTSGSRISGSVSYNVQLLRKYSGQFQRTKAAIRNMTKESILTKIENNSVLVFRSGVRNSNVLDIVESQDNGAADYGILQGSIDLITRAPFARNPDNPYGLESREAYQKEDWERVMRQYAAGLATNVPEFDEVLRYLVSQGETFTNDEDLLLEDQLNFIVDRTLQAYGGDRNPGALAAFLRFLKKKQSMGGDVITVKTPLQIQTTPERALRNYALLQYRKSPTTNTKLSFSESTLAGWYFVVAMRHVVTSNDSYSEFDLVKTGFRLVDVKEEPILGNVKKADPIPKEEPKEEPKLESKGIMPLAAGGGGAFGTDGDTTFWLGEVAIPAVWDFISRGN